MGPPPPSHSKALAELRAAFDMFDKDRSGTIDAGELRQVLKSMGHYPTPVELAELMERMDQNNDGTLDFQEFSDAMLDQAQDEETDRQLEEIRDVFALFDADGSGQLSADELQRALKILGVRLSRGETELLIREIDADGDGEVDCDEFMRYVMTWQPPPKQGEQQHEEVEEEAALEPSHHGARLQQEEQPQQPQPQACSREPPDVEQGRTP